ncbi:hypothetical protein Cob_v011738 [Colletotrichum orbiculare MAFF 240422]|uniref:Uncharacterized protein n=1 Tax=Colletotrichum orbiculare (strain 104-T / ATCC 96160 / CBS 514.97 / LARS 414 / MAFF 240422) TaxID=1213857 RepID=A0A484FCP2_COLOR|nr:hypothetical protein Cob_v011738 [Colletotrichum orbiculare MAFF 240422]
MLQLRTTHIVSSSRLGRVAEAGVSCWCTGPRSNDSSCHDLICLPSRNAHPKRSALGDRVDWHTGPRGNFQ